MAERITTTERVARAYDSTDLSSESYQLNRIKDVDVLTATGIAASREQLASAIMGVYSAGTATSLRRARESVLVITQKLCARRGWGLDDEAITKVAMLSLVHHVAPACRHCHGRGYHTIPGAPALSNRQCSHCKGTGKHQIPKRQREYVLQVLSILERSESLTEHHIRKLLR